MPRTTTAPEWRIDVLGERFEQAVLELGLDPDGEGSIEAVLVRRRDDNADPARTAVLYLPGFSDYLHDPEVADFFADQAIAFFSLDLRKCGRARRPGQTAHYVSDLALYDQELDWATEIIRCEHPGVRVILMGHSTGGLIASLYLARRYRTADLGPFAGLVLSAPWLDLDGSAFLRGPGTWAIRALARVSPFKVLDTGVDTYGVSLHVDHAGEWDYDLTLKPLAGFPRTAGWLAAVRRGQKQLHRGIDVGVPTLVLHSDRSDVSDEFSESSRTADTVLDVEQMSKRVAAFANPPSVEVVADALHDVFLSTPQVRTSAYDSLTRWLRSSGHLASAGT